MRAKENKRCNNTTIQIATWNINSLRKRKPADILPLLDSDIVCLQETKLSKNNVTRDIIAVEELGFQPPCLRFAKKKRYSGTATYCKNTLSIIGEESLQSQDIDEEGRCIITKHKIGLGGNTKGLAVINIYIPYIKKIYSSKCKCDESISQSDEIKFSQNFEINSNQNDGSHFNQTDKRDSEQSEQRNCKQNVERNSNQDDDEDCYESKEANSNPFDEQNFNLNEKTNYHQNKESISDKSDDQNDERSSTARCEEISNSNEMTSNKFIEDTINESNEIRSIDSNENHRNSIETNGKRQEYLLRFLQLVSEKCQDYLKNDFNVILLGDFNFPHKEIDCYNHNHFDDEVYKICRKWIDNMLIENQRDPQMPSKKIFCDKIRELNLQKRHCYTAWHVQTGKRRKNKYGRRIDYILVDNELAKYAESCQIRKCTKGSDHCPVVLTIKATPLSVEYDSDDFTECEKKEAESIRQKNINLETQQDLKQMQEKRKRGRKRKITEISKEEPCTKNPKKKRGRPPKIKDKTTAEGQDLSTETSMKIKRKRGRPPKIKDKTTTEGHDLSTEISMKIKRKRGRPRKIMVQTIKEEQGPSTSEPFMKTKRKRGRPSKIVDMIKKEQENPIFFENYEVEELHNFFFC